MREATFPKEKDRQGKRGKGAMAVPGDADKECSAAISGLLVAPPERAVSSMCPC